MLKEIRIYRTKAGKIPFIEWIESVKDNIGRAQITNRLNRIKLGNHGDCENVGKGVKELKIHYGPGYRVYFAGQDRSILLLLLGGNKRTQQKDIKLAQEYLADFKERCYD